MAATRTEYKESTRAISSTLNELAESHKIREASTAVAKQLKAVEGALGNPSNGYKTIQDNFLSRRVNETGEWIKKDSRYLEWASRKPGTTDILCLLGGEGYGKSFLVSNIISDLRTRLPAENEESARGRASVAFYYFQKEARASKSTEPQTDALSLVTALKSLAWQIANTDAVFLKEMNTIRSQIDAMDKSNLWNTLFSSSYKSDASFYCMYSSIP